METIFDHNVTDLELTRFGGRKNLLKAINELGIYKDADNRYYHIVLLYLGRKDPKTAQKYMKKIKYKPMLETLMQDL